MTTQTLIITAISAATLVACSKSPPKCSDPETLELLREIIVENLGDDHPAASLSAARLNDKLLIQYAKAERFDEKIQKLNCSATIAVPMKIEDLTYQVRIEYESQLDDRDEHIVLLKNLHRGDLLGLSDALISNINNEKNQRPRERTTAEARKRSLLNSESIVGTWKGELEGEGEMKIEERPNGYYLSLAVSAGNCAGSLSGLASLSSQTLTLSKNEDGVSCSITAKFTGDLVEINEDNCTVYHGASCGFSGTLQKVQ